MDDYPLLNLFWTMLLIFCWVLWFFLLFRIIGDLFRDHSLNGWAKAGWIIVLIFLPFLGVLVYVIARGKSMAERDQKQVKEADAAFKQYVRDAAGSGSGAAAAGAHGAAGSPVDQLAKLADLKSNGHISEEEYQKAKAKILA
ncbi:SHOCT domain-containing protein [Streptomyces sp. NPDC088354]|uniref:SHOCT domain-containing protein n=1 Tax=unclassified Streptomyces TaxID=2593676 RepID=UPI0029AA160B|nr:SHOCT domain-containing protein [Streptomyces sp. MI02-7b]MDX3076545.1 SHOCT domain-containing protein [Streptomyces sp. MI02-7b]